MKITARLLALTLIPLVSSMLLTCFVTYRFMKRHSDTHTNDFRAYHEMIIASDLKGRVESAWSIIEDCRKRGIPKEECKKLISAIRFGDNNYLWIHRILPGRDDGAEMLVHPATALVDQDLSGLIDFEKFQKVYYKGTIYDKSDPSVFHLSPTNLFREINAISLDRGEGLFEYYWPKVENGKTGSVGFPKMSYVKLFKPWNWVVGGGEYADHIDSMILKEEKRIKRAEKRVYMSLAGIFTGIALFVGLVSGAFSKKLAGNIKRYEKRILDSREKLQRSEKRIMDIAFSSADIIWEMDQAETYRFIAGNTQNLLGYDPPELIGLTPYDLMAQDEQEEARTYYRSLAGEQKPIIDHRLRCTSKAGETVHILRNATPMTDSNALVTGYRGVDRNITDMIRQEERREVLERELQVAQKLEAIGTLAAGIAHEINTPVQFIGDNTAFLSESLETLLSALDRFREAATAPGDETVNKDLEEIEAQYDLAFLRDEIPLALAQTLEGIQRVAGIVKTMKDFSHMGPGSLAKEDLNNAVETTVTISKSEWKYVAEMKTELDGELPLVSCYIGDIKQVILNLILNAAHTLNEKQAKGHGGMGCITIRTFAEGEDAVLEIGDTGLGIPTESRDRVFDHFFTTKEVGRGTGQGLSMAWQTVVEKHGGTISFHTETGKGTVFTVKLPIDPACDDTTL